MEGYNVHVLAQGGRSLLEYSPPRDLSGGKLVYFLGTADMIKGTPVKQAARYMASHLGTLVGRGYEVVLVPPPNLQLRKFKRINSQYRLTWRKVDFEHVHLCDIAWEWDKKLTWDGIHPVPELSRRLAGAITECLQ